MKYAAVVLFNNRSPLSAVEYTAVTDALLSGGVFLDEVTLLPYDAPMSLSSALTRLALEHDGILVIADSVLLANARKAVETAADESFEEEYLLETRECLYGVLPAGMGGAELVRTETVPRIDKRRKQSYQRVVMCLAGAPAKLVREAIDRANETNLVIHTAEKYGVTRIEIIYDRTTPKFAIDETQRVLASELKEYVYALEDVTIAERLVEMLRVRRKTISVAESFTGGGVGRALVRVPGASDVYFEGLNTYNARAKAERLGVTQFTLEHRGTVSDETAYEMAAGLITGGNCDIAIATTGVAGPKPDEKGNPPGLFYIAVGTKEQVELYRYQLTGDRETVTETAINLALFLAYRALK